MRGYMCGIAAKADVRRYNKINANKQKIFSSTMDVSPKSKKYLKNSKQPLLHYIAVGTTNNKGSFYKYSNFRHCTYAILIMLNGGGRGKGISDF